LAKNVRDLRAKMSPESRARTEAKAERLIQEMALDELRVARALTQEHLSTILGVKQSAISKLERRADMYVSTLRMLRLIRWIRSTGRSACSAGPHGALALGGNELYHQVGPCAILGFNDIN
jgi:DNA-binding transcriptional regulator YiaG